MVRGALLELESELSVVAQVGSGQKIVPTACRPGPTLPRSTSTCRALRRCRWWSRG
jgi:hypothetical protein